MNREEFFQKAVIELSAAVMTQPGAWKQSLDKAIDMADYLTTKLYGVNDTLKLRPVNETVKTPIVAP